MEPLNLIWLCLCSSILPISWSRAGKDGGARGEVGGGCDSNSFPPFLTPSAISVCMKEVAKECKCCLVCGAHLLRAEVAFLL